MRALVLEVEVGGEVENAVWWRDFAAVIFNWPKYAEYREDPDIDLEDTWARLKFWEEIATEIEVIIGFEAYAESFQIAAINPVQK